MVGLETTGTLFEGTLMALDYKTTFLGIPVVYPKSGYASSVVPILVATGVGAKLEKYFKKIVPDTLKLFFVPFLTVIIIVPLTFIVIGPVAGILTNLLNAFFQAIFAIPVLGGVVTGILIGALWQILVIFGLHWAVIPIGIANISTYGSDLFMTPYFAASFAQSMVVAAIYIKTKDKNMKTMALPAWFPVCSVLRNPVFTVLHFLRKNRSLSPVSRQQWAAVSWAEPRFYDISPARWASSDSCHLSKTASLCPM